jgi:plasmid stability protein
MAGLMIRDLPPKLHDRLRGRAKENRRSLSREVIVILEEALEDRAGPPPLEEIDNMRVSGSRMLTQELLDSARADGRP